MRQKMEQAAQEKLDSLLNSAEQLQELVDSWRDEEGELQPNRFPVRVTYNDLEMFAIDLESACDDVIEVAKGITRGRVDSSTLSELIQWREEIFEEIKDLALPDTGAVIELKRAIVKLFSNLAVASKALGSSLKGRRNFYVYLHKDKAGKIFYVGKGTGKRAWSKDRHPLWYKYVDDYLEGNYDVEIVKTDLLESEAEREEAQLMAQYQGQLVNWIDEGSSTIEITADLEKATIEIKGPTGFPNDEYFEALDKFHQKRDESRREVAQVRKNEKIDPERSIERYREAVARLIEYAQLCPREAGLKGQLMGPWIPAGVDLEPLDRLSLLLFKQKRFAELIGEVDAFFEQFPGAREGGVGTRIWKRRERASRSV